jgi:CRISPR/Cas system type I-B associated protein Csh2 (Cas7 group RAMP superfamily)
MVDIPALHGRIICVKRRNLLVADGNPLIDNRPMRNNASTNTISKGSFTRKMERRLVSMAMMVIAYVIEKAVLRSIKRKSTKSSALNNLVP